MARPAHQPDDVRRQVEALAGYGVPEAEIAALVGVDAQDAPHITTATNSIKGHFRPRQGAERARPGRGVTAAIARNCESSGPGDQQSGLAGRPARMTEAVEDLGPLPYASKVEAMAGYGLSPTDIARVLDIDVEELKASYDKELSGGHIKANARVAESLYRKAIGEGRESVTAAIFWLKTRARWKEVSIHEITHDVADPLSALMLRIAEQGRKLHDPH